jgi:hypothetical protein
MPDWARALRGEPDDWRVRLDEVKGRERHGAAH